MQLKIASFLFIAKAGEKGRGIFTRKAIPPMKTIEISSVLVLDAEARKYLDQTTLHDYIFEWGETVEECCVAWGYVSLYNHSYSSNCEYIMDFENNLISIKTIRAIQKNEELTINYNGDWDEKKAVWFDVK